MADKTSSVFFAEITGCDVDGIKRESLETTRMTNCLALAQSIVDEKFELIFKDDDVDLLMERDIQTIQMLTAELNKLNESDVEEQVKNSKATSC